MTKQTVGEATGSDGGWCYPRREAPRQRLGDHWSDSSKRCIDDWGYDEDGETAKVLVRWQGYDESERTWEPLQQVHEDVTVITQKYVDAVNDPGLTAALEEVKIRVADKTSSDDE